MYRVLYINVFTDYNALSVGSAILMYVCNIHDNIILISVPCVARLLAFVKCHLVSIFLLTR